MENQPIFIGKPSINGTFSMAMLNIQRVYTLYYLTDNWEPTRTTKTQIHRTSSNHI